MGFMRLSSVIALCMLWSIMLVFAGQFTNRPRYEITCIVCIRFHIIFRLIDMQIVIPSYERKDVLEAIWTVLPVITMKL